MRYFLAAVFFLLLLAGSFIFWQNKLEKPKETGSNKEQKLTLLFTGDIMLDRGVEFYISQYNDWKWPFLLIADTLRAADLVFGNLESAISDKGENLGSIYSFRADPKTLEGLTFAGFDVLSVANNHSFDYGAEALLDSIWRLKDSGIAPVGGGETEKEANAPALKRFYTSKYSSATTIGILAYTAVGSPFWQAGEQSPGIAWIDITKLGQLKEDIKAAKELSDIVVVSLHFGEEYQVEPTESQKLFSKAAIDAGTDLVVGHHPHVIQPIEHVCTQVTHICGWIAYSLGNFVFDQGFSKETMQGMLLEVIVQDKKITRVTPRSIYLNTTFQPSLQNLAQ